MIKKLLVAVTVAAFPLLGASDATACCSPSLDGWELIDWDPAELDLDPNETGQCRQAIDNIRQMGYRFKDMQAVLKGLCFEMPPRRL